MLTPDLEAHLQALIDISPMPNDAALESDPERVDRYQRLIEAIGREIEDQPSARLVQVLADSFGLGDGFGVYWSTLHLIERIRGEATYEVVGRCAKEGSPGVRQWCCLILGRRRELTDLPIFLALLHDPEPKVVIESLQAIRMLAQRHEIPEAAPPTAALLQSVHSDIVEAARDALAALRS